MNTLSIKRWFIFGLVSLVIVALYGSLMRYKILYDLPFLEQRNLLHAHSHFAFSGWISHMLFVALTFLLFPFLSFQELKKYNYLILLNIVTSYGMLISFTIQGYKAMSIIFSTAAIFAGMLYAIYFFRDLKRHAIRAKFKPWAITALVLNIISSIGPFYIAYMMASDTLDHVMQLGAVYYYLHFQYNGWFFFGTMAIVVNMLPTLSSINRFFRFFAFTVAPMLLLSLLWTKLPMWLYLIALITSIVELIAWIILVLSYWNTIRRMETTLPMWVKMFFFSAAVAMSIKFVLQTLSVIPDLSHAVFGLRPIVIAYLHLVFLGVYSLFIIGMLFRNKVVHLYNGSKIAALVFLVGVILNELVLAVQGFAAFTYTVVPYVNQYLLIAALTLLSGALLLLLTSLKKGLITSNGVKEVV